MAKSVVFVHGAWVTPACWDRFKGRFESRGYTCLAPAWPHDDRPVEELRSSPAPELARVGVGEIVEHYAKVVAGLDEPPLLVGHSFGGLFVQMLLDRGLGVGGAAIDPAPPRGVLPGPNAFRFSFPAIATWRGWRKVLTIPPKRFSWGFVHTLSEPEQREVYQRHVVPTPGRIFFQAALGSGTKVNFRNGTRAPLLITAGELDHAVDPGMNRSNVRRYRVSSALTDFKEFPGRTHWLIAGPGWEEVADFVIDWAERRISA
jgi:pimeloyl-ACP methyl ester carboxylesterase